MSENRKKRAHSMDMVNGPVLPKMLAFSIPLMLSGMLQLLFNAADVAVVGKFAGKNSMAAVGSNGSMVNLLVNVFTGLSIGANVCVARFFGAKQEEELKKAVHTSITAALICGVFLNIIGVLFSRQILILMKTPEEVLPLAALYLKIYFCGMVPMMLYNFGAAILRAIGDTRRPLFFLTIAGFVNLGLNLFTVIVLKMDVAGVGIATVASQFVSAFLVIRCLMMEEGPIKLMPGSLGIDRKSLLSIISVGVPAGIQGTVFSLSNVVIQSTINSYGATIVAGSAAGSNLEGFCYIAMNSFHQSTVSFTSQNYGAGRYDRLWKILGSGMLCVTIAGALVGNLEILLGRQLLSIYTDDPLVVEAGMTRLSIICVVYFFCGAMEVAVGALRGIGYSIMPMIEALLGACVFRMIWLATVYQIPQFHTIEVVYWCYPASWILTLTVHLVSYVIVRRKKDPIWRERMQEAAKKSLA